MEEIVVIQSDGRILLNSRERISLVTRMEQHKELMSVDTLSIEVSSTTPIDFRIGDMITIEGEYYYLNSMPQKKKISSRNFVYSLTFEGAQYKLITVNFLLISMNAQGTYEGLITQSYTGDLRAFVEMIIVNANRVGEKWSIGYVPSNTEVKNLTYNDQNCLQVLQEICKEWDVEFHVDTNPNTNEHILNLYNVDYDVQTPKCSFEYGKGNGLYSVECTPKNDDVVTRLYVYGGSNNLPSNYLRDNHSTRLCLPQKQHHTSYIDDSAAMAQYGVREGVLVLDEIYPKRVGKVSSIGLTDVCKFADDTMDFDLNDPTIKATDTPIEVTFQTGKLAGYTFNVQTYIHEYRQFTLKRREATDIEPELPSQDDTWRIAVGDEYIITGINLPQSYINKAQKELLIEGEYHLNEENNDLYNYPIEVDEYYLKANGIELNIGDFVVVKDDDLKFKVKLRITSLTRDLLKEDDYSLNFTASRKRKNTVYTEWVSKDISKDIIAAFKDDIWGSVPTQQRVIEIRNLKLKANYSGWDIPNGDILHNTAGIIHFSDLNKENAVFYFGEGNTDLFSILSKDNGVIYAKCNKETQVAEIYVATPAEHVRDTDTNYFVRIGEVSGLFGNSPWPPAVGQIVGGRRLKLNSDIWNEDVPSITRPIVSEDGITKIDFSRGEITAKILQYVDGEEKKDVGTTLKVMDATSIEHGRSIEGLNTKVVKLDDGVKRSSSPIQSLTSRIIANYENDPSLLYIGEGVYSNPLFRDKTWMIKETVIKVEDVTKAYYIYLILNRGDESSEVQCLTTTPIEDNVNYYVLVGVLNAVMNDERNLTTYIGNSSMSATNIIGGRLVDLKGNPIVDLRTSKIFVADDKHIFVALDEEIFGKDGLRTIVGITPNDGLRRDTSTLQTIVGVDETQGMQKELSQIKKDVPVLQKQVDSIIQNIDGMTISDCTQGACKEKVIVIDRQIPKLP